MSRAETARKRGLPAQGQHSERTTPGASIPREVMTELSRPNPLRWTLALASDWLTIVLALLAAGWIDHLVAYAVASFVIATRQQAIAILGHEGAHKIVSRRVWLNETLSQLFCFWPLSVDLHAYRQFHLTHHRYLNTAQDPEMAYRKLGAPGWDLPCSQRLVARRFVADLFGFGAFEIVRIMRFTIRWTFPAVLGPMTLIGGAIAIAALTGHLWVIALWFISLFGPFAALWRFRCWIEHQGTDDTHRLYLSWWQAWLVAPHNMWAHWEHHHWSGIPFWNLLRLRDWVPTVKVIRLSELFKFYEECAAIESGTPTKV